MPATGAPAPASSSRAWELRPSVRPSASMTTRVTGPAGLSLVPKPDPAAGAAAVSSDSTPSISAGGQARMPRPAAPSRPAGGGGPPAPRPPPPPGPPGGGVGQALREAGNLGPAGVDERAPELLQRLLRLGLALSGLLPQPLLVLQVVPRGHGRTEEGESHHGRVDRDPHADPEDSREADL